MGAKTLDGSIVRVVAPFEADCTVGNGAHHVFLKRERVSQNTVFLAKPALFALNPAGFRKSRTLLAAGLGFHFPAADVRITGYVGPIVHLLLQCGYVGADFIPALLDFKGIRTLGLLLLGLLQFCMSIGNHVVCHVNGVLLVAFVQFYKGIPALVQRSLLKLRHVVLIHGDTGECRTCIRRAGWRAILGQICAIFGRNRTNLAVFRAIRVSFCRMGCDRLAVPIGYHSVKFLPGEKVYLLPGDGSFGVHLIASVRIRISGNRASDWLAVNSKCDGIIHFIGGLCRLCRVFLLLELRKTSDIGRISHFLDLRLRHLGNDRLAVNGRSVEDDIDRSVSVVDDSLLVGGNLNRELTSFGSGEHIDIAHLELQLSVNLIGSLPGNLLTCGLGSGVLFVHGVNGCVHVLEHGNIPELLGSGIGIADDDVFVGVHAVDRAVIRQNDIPSGDIDLAVIGGYCGMDTSGCGVGVEVYLRLCRHDATVNVIADTLNHSLIGSLGVEIVHDDLLFLRGIRKVIGLQGLHFVYIVNADNSFQPAFLALVHILRIVHLLLAHELVTVIEGSLKVSHARVCLWVSAAFLLCPQHTVVLLICLCILKCRPALLRRECFG